MKPFSLIRVFPLCVVAASLACHNMTQDQVGIPPKQATLYTGQDLPLSNTLLKIALGSCNRHDLPQNIWRQIDDERADLWIWLGDNIYGDTENMDRLKSKYLSQKYQANYRAFRSRTPVIGIWDDHDYGVNDGGKDYPKKEESQQLLLDFLDVPPEAEVRSRAGAYQSYTFGAAGQQVKIILLDARYFRDSLEKNPGGYQRYRPNLTGDILGEAQWEWLEQELSASTAQINLIASGIQIIPEEHGFEKWANFPAARARLLALIASTKPKRPILLSGDRHISEFSRLLLDGLSEPLYEMTSSGLTHSYESFSGEPNQHRVGLVVSQRSYGLIRIDWASGKAIMTLQIKGVSGEVLQELILD